ncbi:MAG TPA: DUF2784 domain-containing protein [Candidatus Polarisedimenticolia bacterium]|nr:DUF2784 domain-containing protein [Candidatus Polarisedimenticolia bacterium]
MPYGRLADLVVLLHFAFVLFVCLGGLAVLRWPRVAWAHLPAVAWGVAIEYVGLICPLTPLEIALRRRAGGAGYEGDFLGRYVTALIYPEGLTRPGQIVLGTAALAVNVVAYGLVWRRRRAAGAGAGGRSIAS